MIEFNPTTFASQFRALAADDESEFELDEIDDAFHQSIKDSDDARACSHIAVQILRAAERPWPLADALNTALCASCLSGDVEQARVYLEELIDVTAKHGTPHAARGAAENIRRLLPGRANPDYVVHLLHLAVRLYTHLGMHEEVIETQIIAAHLFGDFGAYRAAIRALTDAQVLARDHKLSKPYLDAVSALHGIYLQMEEHASADHVWTVVRQNCAEAGIAMPMPMMVNRATTLLQLGELDAARSGFEEALAAMEEGAPQRLTVLINLSACLRELGERAQSELRMTEARDILSTLPTVDPEVPLELELIAAKSAVHHCHPAEATECLQRAVKSLDAAVDLVEKLHYRRGMRERYVPRIERVLAELPPTGKAEDVVRIVAATRANRMSDWLHFLEWTRDVASRLTTAETGELDRLVSRLANHGAPHLYGMRERADDPMSLTSLPDPWRDLAEYADKVCLRHGVSRPFEQACSRTAAELIDKRLAEGYAVLVNMFTAGQKVLLLIGDRYMLGYLPDAETKAFSRALSKHRFDPQQKLAMANAAAAYQAALLASLSPLLEELAGDECKGVVLLPDKMDRTPISLIALGHPGIRGKMAAGQFEARTCLALYPAQRHIGAPRTCLGIVEPGSNLPFDRADVESFLEGSGASGTVLEKPSWEEFSARMSAVDSLVLAHHGTSVALFTDPHFADMAGAANPSSMSLAAIQEAAFRWPHRLVLLGTCHSGGLVNHSFQGVFRTHDLTGFPTAFLVNGKCEVIAASWEIFDGFNLVFTTLLAPRLDGATASQAVSTALALLFEMQSDDLAALLTRSLPAGAELSATALSHIDVMRREPFFFGAYQTFTLL